MWKHNSKGDNTELSNVDLEHIAEAIKEGYTSGEVIDSDLEEENEKEDTNGKMV